MTTYRLVERKFSRIWRRNKSYSDRDLKWLARRRNLDIVELKGRLKLVDKKTKNVVANFDQVVKDKSTV